MCSSVAHGASFQIEAPERALSNRQPIVVMVRLDTETKTISGVSGDFSFPSELFTLENISLEGSVVPIFIQTPSLSEEKYIDGRTHIVFEGIFPGGFDGVSSPHAKEKSSGGIFSLLLIPTAKGEGLFSLDQTQALSFGESPKNIAQGSVFKKILVPSLLTNKEADVLQAPHSNEKLNAFILRDPLISANAWYVSYVDSHTKSARTHVYVAETKNWSGELVPEVLWKQTTLPYVLTYQSRNMYVHVKAVYADGTYALTTLPPVENSGSISIISRILLGIAFLGIMLLVYGKKLILFFKKHS